MGSYNVSRLLLLAGAFIASVAWGAPKYVAVPLGTLGGPGSSPWSINERGEVAGFSYLPLLDPHQSPGIPGNGAWHAALFANGSVRDLGLTPDGLSAATGINATGAMSAFALDAKGMRALLVAGDRVVDVAPAGADYARAWGINDAGEVTGYAESLATGATHAFIYSNGVSKDIHGLGLASEAWAINARGEATGSYWPSEDGVTYGSNFAFIYTGGKMQALDETGVGSSSGRAVDDHGRVAGDMWKPGWAGNRAFLYEDGAMRDLGTLGGESSFTFGMNNHGVVVGVSEVAGGAYRAFVYIDGAMLDLNAGMVSGLDGATLTGAFDVNDRGQIVATACLGIGLCQAFVLDPLPGAATKVQAIEFHHASFDHYFLTADVAEIDALDRGAFAGWVRTGESLRVFAQPEEGASPVCRYFSVSFGPKSSHFFTPLLSECMRVNANVDWQFEGVRQYVKRPDASGACPSGTSPVYRLYNDGQGGAPAHRLTTKLAVRDAMRVDGWISEGSGTDGVGMCAPD